MTSSWKAIGPVVATVLAAAACGGTVVFEEPDGSGGNGGSSSIDVASNVQSVGQVGPGPTTVAVASSGSAVSSAEMASASSGPSGCSSHDDCPGELCVFSTGACAPRCESGFCDGCGEGSVCDGCATASCPACADCAAACVPVQPGRCDDDDDECPEGQACDFGSTACRPLCGLDGTCPPDSGLECVGCAVGSCCGCDDCVGLCFALTE